MLQINNIGIAFSVSAGARRFQRLEEGLGHLAGLGYRLVDHRLELFGVKLEREAKK